MTTTMRAFLVGILYSAAAFGRDTTFTLDPAKTSVSFTLGDVLHTVHGLFHMDHGTIAFDTSNGSASGEIVVKVPTGDSGSGARDKRMHKEILESDKFPEAVFRPDHVEGALAATGASDLKVHGNLTLHGSPHEITMAVHVETTASGTTAVATFAIPYVKWGLKNPSNFLLKVNDTVDMKIQTAGTLR